MADAPTPRPDVLVPAPLRQVRPGDPVVPGLPEREGHRLTRQGMMQVLAGGGSIHYPDPDNPAGFRVITHPDHLPSAEAMAAGNPEAERAALADIDAQIASLATRRASLTAKAAPAGQMAGGPQAEVPTAPEAPPKQDAPKPEAPPLSRRESPPSPDPAPAGWPSPPAPPPPPPPASPAPPSAPKK